MKLITAVIASGFLALSLGAQSQDEWINKFYDSLTNENFREFPLFNESFDLENIDYARIDAAVFFVSNEKRIAQGLTPLEFEPLLEKMALSHSKDMINEAFFDHRNLTNELKYESKDRALLAGIQNPYIAENIYYSGGKQYESYLALADATVSALMGSPPHKKNILHTSAIQLGCGIFYYPDLWKKNNAVGEPLEGIWMVTQNFQFYLKVEGKNESY